MDKRQHRRLALEEMGWSAELLDQVTGEKLGEVVNISPGGLMLLTERTLEIEGLFQVTCHTLGPDGQSERFSAGVMVLWCSAARQANSYWAGMQIIDIDTESWDRLRAFSAALADAD